MAIKLNSDGSREIVDITSKVDKSYFTKTWYPVQLLMDKSTAYVFNSRAKYINCALNKLASEKAGCNIYGIVYIIHPDMISARIKEVTVKDVMAFDKDRKCLTQILGLKGSENKIPKVKKVMATVKTPVSVPEPVEEIKPEFKDVEEKRKQVEEKRKQVEEKRKQVEEKQEQVEEKQEQPQYSDVLSGVETIRLIRQIQSCPTEALDVLQKYCQFPMAQLDVKMFIAMEKEERMQQ